MAKKWKALLTWLTHVAGSFEHTVVLRAVLSRAITVKPLLNKRSGFSSSNGFLTVRLASRIWLSFTYKHLSKRSPPPYWTPASFAWSRTEAYPMGPPVSCVVSITLCCVLVIFCCVSTTLCCVSIILCCLSVILCCVSTICAVSLKFDPRFPLNH